MAIAEPESGTLYYRESRKQFVRRAEASYALIAYSLRGGGIVTITLML